VSPKKLWTADLRLSLYNRTVQLKDLLPIIEEYPTAVLKGTDITIRVPHPIDPIPEPVNDDLASAHGYVEAADNLKIPVPEEIRSASDEFVRRRDVNLRAGQEHNQWSFQEQERLQRILDGTEEP
jgi:hypothetical protein